MSPTLAQNANQGPAMTQYANNANVPPNVQAVINGGPANGHYSQRNKLAGIRWRAKQYR